MLSIKVARITPIQTVHYLEKISFGCLEDEVIMIVHQNIGMDQNPVAIMIIGQNAQEVCTILLIQKYLPPLVPPTRNVVQRPIEFYSYRSSHNPYHVTKEG